MEKHQLSKSTYIKGEQCLKQLYLHKKRPFLRDRLPAERLAIFSRGTKVGVIAQDLFPGGIDAGPKHPSQYRKAVETTAKLVSAGQSIIYEAAFQANKTLILLDILVRNGNAWDAYEVKSSKALSETYYKDAALQYYVLKNAGLEINSFSLIHINTDYERDNELDLKQLFIITDVTDEVQQRIEGVKSQIMASLQIMEEDHSPKIDIGTHCFHPYDCDFIGHCWKGISSPSVFDIPSIDFDQQLTFHQQERNLEQLLLATETSEQQKLEIQVQLQQQPWVKLTDEFKAKLENAMADANNSMLLKIIHFTPALPLYPGTKAYQPIAFGFAYLPLNGKAADAVWHIADGKNNPNDEILIELSNISNNKNLITFNQYALGLETLDLKDSISQGMYYSPAMKKDYSNKSLSRALGIKAPWKGIESDIVAAQFYDEIRREHKDSEGKHKAIVDYLVRELVLAQKFFRKLVE
jgi:hypothetical protein